MVKLGINAFEGFALIMVGLFFAGAASVMFSDTERYVKYDCRMVDVSPDMPEDIKRICRSRR